MYKECLRFNQVFFRKHTAVFWAAGCIYWRSYEHWSSHKLVQKYFFKANFILRPKYVLLKAVNFECNSITPIWIHRHNHPRNNMFCKLHSQQKSKLFHPTFLLNISCVLNKEKLYSANNFYCVHIRIWYNCISTKLCKTSL